MKRFNRLITLLSVICGFSLIGCNSNPKITDSLQEPVTAMRNPIVKSEPKIYRPEIKYTVDSLENYAQIDSLFGTYSEEEMNTILKLNRIQKNRLRPRKKLIIPDCAAGNFNNYSPFPEHLSAVNCLPKAVLISQRVQAFALYENGDLIKWGPVSTGKYSTRTPNGLNYGTYKAKRKISTVDPSWIMPYYFNFMNDEGIGTHQYSLPGYPASHGCVRMKMDDAKFIYNWAEMWEIDKGQIQKNGTPFMVFGKYDYSSDRPWYSLAQDMHANDLNDDEIATISDYLKRYQNDPRNFSNPELIGSRLASTENEANSVN